MPEAPDLAGFEDAQHRLREAFGEPVIFLMPPVETWPPGTELDPETGRPYDPMLEPLVSNQEQRQVTCDVATRPFTGSDVEFAPVGLVEREHQMLACDLAYASAASGAIEYEVRGSRYAVTSQRPDGIGRVQRFLTFGRRR